MLNVKLTVPRLTQVYSDVKANSFPQNWPQFSSIQVAPSSLVEFHRVFSLNIIYQGLKHEPLNFSTALHTDAANSQVTWISHYSTFTTVQIWSMNSTTHAQTLTSLWKVMTSLQLLNED